MPGDYTADKLQELLHHKKPKLTTLMSIPGFLWYCNDIEVEGIWIFLDHALDHFSCILSL